MTSKSGIKNVQARIDQDTYEMIQDIIKDINATLGPEEKENKYNLQKVIVEALSDWIRKNQKDNLLSLSGVLKK